MARIRYLHPGFFKDEHLALLPHWVRLLFAGMWTIADREGRLKDSPIRIKGELFPYEEVDVKIGLAMLEGVFENAAEVIEKYALEPKAFILRYQSDGKRFIQILNWHKKQNVHKQEQPSSIPPPLEEDLKKSEQLRNNFGTTSEVAQKFSAETEIEIETEIETEIEMGIERKSTPENGEPVVAFNIPKIPEFNPDLDRVYKDGFNIYAMINKAKKELGWKNEQEFESEVLIGVCNSYWRNKPGIKNRWAWFVKALEDQVKVHNARKNEAQGKIDKNAPIFIGDLLKTITTRKGRNNEHNRI